MAGRWRETSPNQLAAWMARVTVPWAFAGGWALDLWAGQQSRVHSDIEITCLRRDLSALVSALPDFEVVVAQNKQLSAWSSAAPPPPSFSLWLRRHGETLWDFEILSEIHDEDVWRYRRDERVALPLDRLIRQTDQGWPVIAPEVQLLYKCRQPRDKDIADLRQFWPLLDPAARAWLRQAAALAHPEAMALFEEMDRPPAR